MTFARFMAPSGAIVSIKTDQVVTLRQPLEHEMAPGARTVIVLTNGQFQAVREPMDVVEARLEA